GHDLDILLSEKVPEMTAIHRADADEPQRDALAGRGLLFVTQGRTRNDQRHPECRRGRSADELPARQSTPVTAHVLSPLAANWMRPRPDAGIAILPRYPGHRRMQPACPIFPGSGHRLAYRLGKRVRSR